MISVEKNEIEICGDVEELGTDLLLAKGNKDVLSGNYEIEALDMLTEAFLNGTPLPKGHGRLIDADALGEKLNRYTEAPYQYALTVFNESPTIIKADRGDEK